MLVVTIGIGVDYAGLNFGSSNSKKGPTQAEKDKQSGSGITSELRNVLGTFDMKVDVFGLLSGNFNIEPSGKFGLMVGSMEVDVPNAVNVTATGIRVNYDPDYVEGSEENGPGAQKLVEVTNAVITFPSLNLQGVMKNLVVRTNGFSLGEANVCYGCLDGDTGTALNSDGSAATGKPAIKIGSILEFDDIRIGVEDFDVTFGEDFVFKGKIYIASGGAKFLPGKAVSGSLKDGSDSDTEAFRAGMEFGDDGKVKAFEFDVDTLELKLSSLVTLSATDFKLNTGAEDDQNLVSFGSAAAQVKVGSLLLSGQATSFAILGNGDFKPGKGFGLIIGVGSATGKAFKWPSFIPIRITEIGIQWDDIEEDPTDFSIILSAELTEIKGIKGLEFSGAIRGIKISPQLLLEGKNPIVDIESIGVGVEGKMFGGEVAGALIGGILKLDSSSNIIGALDTVTEVDQRVFFVGVEGKFSMKGIGGFGIRFALSELGPLSVLINADVPVLLEPTSGLTISDFYSRSRIL